MNNCESFLVALFVAALCSLVVIGTVVPIAARILSAGRSIEFSGTDFSEAVQIRRFPPYMDVHFPSENVIPVLLRQFPIRFELQRTTIIWEDSEFDKVSFTFGRIAGAFVEWIFREYPDAIAAMDIGSRHITMVSDTQRDPNYVPHAKYRNSDSSNGYVRPKLPLAGFFSSPPSSQISQPQEYGGNEQKRRERGDGVCPEFIPPPLIAFGIAAAMIASGFYIQGRRWRGAWIAGILATLSGICLWFSLLLGDWWSPLLCWL